MTHRIVFKTFSVLAAALTPAAAVAFTPASAGVLPPGVTATTSVNYAGWRAPAGSKPTAHATFKVPHVTCGSADVFVAPGAEIQTASSVVQAGVAVGCEGGAPFFSGEYDIKGTITPFSVNVQPVDKVVVSLTVTSAKSTGSFQDVTQGFKKSFSGAGVKGTKSCVGVDGSSEAGGPIPNFGKVTFSASKINDVTIAAAGAAPENMVSSGGVLQVKTGALNGAGTGFTATFEHTGS